MRPFLIVIRHSDFVISSLYRGRLAPSPTGHFHLGHARTFWTARTARHGRRPAPLSSAMTTSTAARCRPEFISAMFEDLQWFGLHWSEGPDIGGPHAPYDQSRRLSLYAAAFENLRRRGLIYPCNCSRRTSSAPSAPHISATKNPSTPEPAALARGASPIAERSGVNWRFRVPAGETLTFTDSALGPHTETAGQDFGDFLIWRKDDLPSYQLACTVDDADMQITEVVRGADLLTSTCRQLLLYRALELKVPAFHHCPLLTDASGVRLAKRDHATSLRTLRATGATPESLRAKFTA